MKLAFWLTPDWSGGREKPFWLLPPKIDNPNFCNKHGEWLARSVWYNGGDAGLCCQSCYREGHPAQQARRFP